MNSSDVHLGTMKLLSARLAALDIVDMSPVSNRPWSPKKRNERRQHCINDTRRPADEINTSNESPPTLSFLLDRNDFSFALLSGRRLRLLMRTHKLWHRRMTFLTYSFSNQHLLYSSKERSDIA